MELPANDNAAGKPGTNKQVFLLYGTGSRAACIVLMPVYTLSSDVQRTNNAGALVVMGVKVRKPTRSERRSSWMAVTAAVIGLLLAVVFAYAYFGSHVDSVTPAAQQAPAEDSPR